MHLPESMIHASQSLLTSSSFSLCNWVGCKYPTIRRIQRGTHCVAAGKAKRKRKRSEKWTHEATYALTWHLLENSHRTKGKRKETHLVNQLALSLGSMSYFQLCNYYTLADNQPWTETKFPGLNNGTHWKRSGNARHTLRWNSHGKEWRTKQETSIVSEIAVKNDLMY